MDLAQILQRLCPPTNAQLQTRTPPTQLPGGQGPPKRLFPFSLRGYVPWGVGRSQTGGVCPPPSRPSHAHLPDEAVGGGVRRGAAIRALEAALALAVLALQRGVTGLGGALWASPPQHPQQHRFRTEHRELLRSAPPAATTQHPQTPTHQSGGGGQDVPPPPPPFAHSVRMLCLLKSWVLLVPLGTQLESICKG